MEVFCHLSQYSEKVYAKTNWNCSALTVFLQVNRFPLAVNYFLFESCLSVELTVHFKALRIKALDECKACARLFTADGPSSLSSNRDLYFYIYGGLTGVTFMIKLLSSSRRYDRGTF